MDDVCSGELVAVAPDDDIDRAVQLMLAKALDRLPVVDDGRPVGVVALEDLAVEPDPDSVRAYAGAPAPHAWTVLPCASARLESGADR